MITYVGPTSTGVCEDPAKTAPLLAKAYQVYPEIEVGNALTVTYPRRVGAVVSVKTSEQLAFVAVLGMSKVKTMLMFEEMVAL